MMRNKLKRSKIIKTTPPEGKDQAQTTEVIVLSESSCTDDETLQESYSTATREKRKTFCKKGVKIAPIFISAIQNKKNKRISYGGLDQRVEDTPKSASFPQNNDGRNVPTTSHLTLRDVSAASTCRRQLSTSALLNCLEEIQTLNPAFSIQTVFSTLQKKASDGVGDGGATDLSLHQDSLENNLKETRKRGSAISAKLPQHLQTVDARKGYSPPIIQDFQEKSVFAVQKPARRSKLSCTGRLRWQSGSLAGLENNYKLNSGWSNYPQSDTQLLKGAGSLQRDSCFEEALWTDKYSPQHSSEVIGNPSSVKILLSWLKKWKLRANCDERRETGEKKEEENDSWDCGDFQGEAGLENRGEGSLSNTMLITGPSGVGKTAAVYACAQELGFKVFEVNSSSQRSGRHVLSQLKEATQSHLVEISGKDALKPAYFSNYSNNSCTLKSEALPGKFVRPKNVTSTLKKRPGRSLSISGHKVKAKPDTLTLAHYFKMKDKADQFHFGGMSSAVKPDAKEQANSSRDGDQTVQQSKKTATSLILFEEVDIIFEEDVGFLASIKAFMKTTRRPVILTTSDPSFKRRFDCSLEEIIFKIPSAVNVCSYLQLVCLAENAQLDSEDVHSLFTLTCGDIRRCLLQLQFWVLSGEGSASQFEGFPNETVCPQYSEAPEGNCFNSQLLQRRTGCSAHMLGLHSETSNHLLNILKCESWSQTDMQKLLKILSESWRRGVPLLYSNLELLLSLRAKGTSTCYLDKKAVPELHCEPQRSNSDPYIQQQNQSVSPKVSAAYSKSARSLSRLSRKKFKAIVHDTKSSSSLTNTIQRTLSLNCTPLRGQSSNDTIKQKVARGEKDCLDTLTNLFELMSYLDATLPVPGSCTPDSFVWTGAALKDGLLDEMSEDDGSSNSHQEGLMDIKAAVEGLGCHIGFSRVSDTWTLTQTYTKELEYKRREGLMDRMAMNVSAIRQRFSFTSPPLCEPCVSHRRFKLGRMVLSSNYFSLLGNRQAVCVDFMPVLRFICRSLHAQQQKGELVRCVDYLSSLGLSNSTMKLLTEDFPQKKMSGKTI